MEIEIKRIFFFHTWFKKKENPFPFLFFSFLVRTMRNSLIVPECYEKRIFFFFLFWLGLLWMLEAHNLTSRSVIRIITWLRQNGLLCMQLPFTLRNLPAQLLSASRCALVSKSVSTPPSLIWNRWLFISPYI